MWEELGSPVWAWVLGGVVALSAGLVFRRYLRTYQHVSGDCVELSALRTLVFVGLLVGVAALSWWLANLWLAPGRWRDAVFLLTFSALEGTVGKYGGDFVGAWIERWYHL